MWNTVWETLKITFNFYWFCVVGGALSFPIIFFVCFLIVKEIRGELWIDKIK